MFQVHKPSPPRGLAAFFSGNMIKHIKAFWRDEDAASAVEYGLLVALIAAVIIVAVKGFGKDFNKIFKKLAKKLK